MFAKHLGQKVGLAGHTVAKKSKYGEKHGQLGV